VLLSASTPHKILTSAFQLLLNPVKQTDDAEKGLDCIAGLLVLFKLVEKAYSKEIEEDTEGYFIYIYPILRFLSLPSLAPEKQL
jgi:hypothetical protein